MAQLASDQKGQSVVELFVCLVPMVAAASAIGLCLYVAIAYAWIQFAAYEALICKYEGEIEWKCKLKTQNRIHQVLSKRHPLFINFKYEGQSWNVLIIGPHQLRIHRTISDPAKTVYEKTKMGSQLSRVLAL